MPSRNQGVVVTYEAYNTNTGAYQTGDSANHTLRLVKDGTEAAATNAPSEIDSTNLPGMYALALASAETNFNLVTVGGKSSTANVILISKIIGFENLPISLSQSSGINVSQIASAQAASSLASGNVNLVAINGSVTVTSSAQLGVNLVTWEGAVPAPLVNALVQATVSGTPGVNVTQWAGGAVPAPNVTGEPLVDVNHWRGTQPNNLVSNRVDASVGALAAGVILNTSFGAGALTTAVFASNFLTGSLIDPTGGATIADDLLDRSNAIETGITPRQAWRYVAAAEAGVTSGALTTTFSISAIANNGTNRITATTTASGNRTAITLN